MRLLQIVLSNKFVQGSQRKNGSGNSNNSLMLGGSKLAAASKYKKGDSVRSDCMRSECSVDNRNSMHNSMKSCDEEASTKDDTYQLTVHDNSVTVTAVAPVIATAAAVAAGATAAVEGDADATIAAGAGDSGTVRLLAPDA
jgi:phage tail sheath gpL-like